MAKVLTDQEVAFIELLFDPELKGNASLAKRAAGYSESTKASTLISKLSDEILAYGEKVLVSHTPRAIIEMVNIFDSPTHPNTKDVLNVAKEILDRAGLAKKDKIQVDHTGISNVFYLPEKKK
jgi:hypothetical protein